MCIGDFNFDIHLNDDTVGKYVEMLSRFGFENLIDIGTRVTDVTSSRLDHLLFKGTSFFNCQAFVLDSSITDHRNIGNFIGLINNVESLLRNNSAIDHDNVYQLLSDET